MRDIIDLEENYKKMLMSKLSGNKKISLSCPDFKYPEPVFVYVKSIKTEKSIAVRLDGGDKTVRFWDYVDDDYSEEDGVWDEMSAEGLDRFIKKLNRVMENAVDIEFYGADGECDDYFSGVAKAELTAENASKTLKKLAKNKNFVLVKVSDFYGDKQYAFDRNLKQIK